MVIEDTLIYRRSQILSRACPP